jgi:hypothetical protein
MREFSDREFVAGSLTGLRSFQVDALGRLTAVTNNAVWRPGVNHGECKKSEYSTSLYRLALSSYTFSFAGEVEPPKPKPVSLVKKSQHRVGSLRCECGFYAYTDTDANPYRERDGVVVGLVEGWGSVTVGSRGFRASQARIVALVDSTPAPLWRRITKRGWLNLGVAPLNAATLGDHARRDGFDPTFWVFLGITLAWLTACLVLLVKSRKVYVNAATGRSVVPSHVRRNYPDVPVYPSLRAALAAHPITPPPPPIAPTPETDPEFWTRPVSR